MNKKVIETVLTELLDEIKEIRTEQTLNDKAVELYSEAINHFEDLLKQIKITCPPPDIAPLVQLVNTRFKEIEKVVAEKPVNVIHKKQILFYPEGDGQNFVKFISDRFLRYLTIVGGICLIAWIGLYFWKQNSENERMKYCLYWYYDKVNQNEKDKINAIFHELKNDSIYQARKKMYK